MIDEARINAIVEEIKSIESDLDALYKIIDDQERDSSETFSYITQKENRRRALCYDLSRLTTMNPEWKENQAAVEILDILERM